MLYLVVFSFFFSLVFCMDPAPTTTEKGKCHMTESYPPPSDRNIGWYTIDLDAAPQDRWTEPVTHFKTEIQQLIDLIVSFDLAKTIITEIQKDSNSVLERFPNDWGQEIASIAQIIDREVADVIFYNIAYEVMGFCTSIVAMNTDGSVYHGRNLDFGLYPDVNWSDVQWELTQDLRPILFNANLTKNGETLYKTTVFAGYVGVLTGVRENAMTITVDSRYDNNFDKYLLDWFLNTNDNSQFLTFATREAMETYDNYDDAVNFILQTSFIGPAFIIIGGSNPYEGCVCTMGPNRTLANYWDIAHGLPANDTTQNPWYVLETNYNHWDQPPWFDDRRYPAEDCMGIVGPSNIQIPTLYNVLNGVPNRNRLTTYTTLMYCATGHLEAYKQYCDELDCPPWQPYNPYNITQVKK